MFPIPAGIDGMNPLLVILTDNAVKKEIIFSRGGIVKPQIAHAIDLFGNDQSIPLRQEGISSADTQIDNLVADAIDVFQSIVTFQYTEVMFIVTE
jgi:hypothetical protein